MAKISIVNSGPLWSNPRSVKEADALSSAGHDVTVIGHWLDETSAHRDTQLVAGKRWSFRPALDLTARGVNGWFRKVGSRVRSRASHELYKRARFYSAGLHGYGGGELLSAALKSGADLTIVHSEMGLWVGKQLIERGHRVGVDFEDWFSEDLAPDRTPAKRLDVLRSLEGLHAQRCRYSVAASKAMALSLAAEYASRPPEIVYNAFANTGPLPLGQSFRDRRSPDALSLHWFSQTIGPGRGLETLFEALSSVDGNVEVHLRGQLTLAGRAWLNRQMSEAVSGKVYLHDLVPNDELLPRVAEHDVGLCLETGLVRSRDVTVTNKLFQYMQAGLALIATDTQGQKEIFDVAPDIGILVRKNEPQCLAQAIQQFKSDRAALQRAKQAASAAFDRDFYWEQNIKKIADLAEEALRQSVD